MKLYMRFLVFFTLTCAMLSLATERDTSTIYLRLKFDKKSDSTSYLWGQKVVSRDIYWAEESSDGKQWVSIPGSSRRVKVGVALAGGVVRGIAHIGVLRALEENNIPIYGISGTSMGAIIGGLYACGYSVDDLESVVKDSIDWETFFSDQPPRQHLPIWERLREKPRQPGLDLSFTGKLLPPLSYEPGKGIRVAQKFTDEIAKLTLKAEYRAGFVFDNLPIPYGAMLTNMKTGKSKLMREGTISTAARASGSVPIAFEPMKIRGIPYVDGGILDNLPVDAFLRFDSSRAPDNMMTIIDKDTINYVIAVYPSKRKNLKEIETPELSGLLGIGVMNRSSCLARDYHVWDSWYAAQGRIDVDVEGGFDFSHKKLDEMISAGSYAAWKEMCQIKGEIADKEKKLTTEKDSLKSRGKIQSIHCISSIKVDTTLLKGSKGQERIEKAIRLKQGSYVLKIDICDALKRVFDLGDFEDVRVKIENTFRGWKLTFYGKKRKEYKDSLNVVMEMDFVSVYDSLAEKAVKEAVEKAVKEKKRALNFEEIKELVERSLVKQGFVAPHVDSVKFCHSKEKADTLAIYGNKGTCLNRVKITLCDTNDIKTKEAIENEFSKPLSPRKVLDRVAYIRKEFQLRTISVEGYNKDSLIIAVEKKSAATLEFPSITLENLEGLNFFSEMRIRRVRRFADLSPYINYTQNFPMKDTRELPKGHGFEVGVERCRSFSFVPDLSAYWKKLKFSSEVDTSVYDREFEEVSGQLTLPVYHGDFAFIPGFEVASVTMNGINDEREWQRQVGGILWLRYDKLDRFIFPESGWKADIDARVGINSESWTNPWARTRVRIMGVPIRYRIQGKAMTTLTLQFFGSWHSEETPYHECYSLGGLTPIGSYQLRLLDYEDLPGYVRDEFIKPIMWKVGGSARIAFMEMEVLGIRANVHLEGSAHIADAVQRGEDLFVWDRKKVSQAVGLYLDTSFLNIGLVFKGTDRKFLNHFHLSVVLYGFGF